jgi:hypothetical protein
MEMRITVQTYAGYMGDERPVSFSREGRTFHVTENTDRWYDPDHSCFKVLADDGKKVGQGSNLLNSNFNSVGLTPLVSYHTVIPSSRRSPSSRAIATASLNSSGVIRRFRGG